MKKKRPYQVVSAGVVGVVHGFSVASIDEEFLGSLGEAVAAVEAEFSEKRDSLQVDDHVFHQLEFSDQSLFLLGEVVTAHGRVHVEERIFELTEKLVLLVLVQKSCDVEPFEGSVVSEGKIKVFCYTKKILEQLEFWVRIWVW